MSEKNIITKYVQETYQEYKYKI